MYCPHVGLADCVFLHSSFGSPCVEGLCVTWLLPVGNGEIKMCENSWVIQGVACWPLVPKFAGSNPAEAVRFLGRKNPQHAFLRRGSKAVGPMS